MYDLKYANPLSAITIQNRFKSFLLANLIIVIRNKKCVSSSTPLIAGSQIKQI